MNNLHKIVFIFAINALFSSNVFAYNNTSSIDLKANVVSGCQIKAEDGSFGVIDYLASHPESNHGHFRDVYATTPIKYSCSKGINVSISGTPQETITTGYGSAYKMKRVDGGLDYFWINPYLDNRVIVEGIVGKLFQGQKPVVSVATGNVEDFTLLWVAFNNSSDRTNHPMPKSGDYSFSMTLNFTY